MNTVRRGKESTFFSLSLFSFATQNMLIKLPRVDFTGVLTGELARKRIIGWETETKPSLDVGSSASHLILLI